MDKKSFNEEDVWALAGGGGVVQVMGRISVGYMCVFVTITRILP